MVVSCFRFIVIVSRNVDLVLIKTTHLHFITKTYSASQLHLNSKHLNPNSYSGVLPSFGSDRIWIIKPKQIEGFVAEKYKEIKIFVRVVVVVVIIVDTIKDWVGIVSEVEMINSFIKDTAIVKVGYRINLLVHYYKCYFELVLLPFKYLVTIVFIGFNLDSFS